MSAASTPSPFFMDDREIATDIPTTWAGTTQHSIAAISDFRSQHESDELPSDGYGAEPADLRDIGKGTHSVALRALKLLSDRRSKKHLAENPGAIGSTRDRWNTTTCILDGYGLKKHQELLLHHLNSEGYNGALSALVQTSSFTTALQDDNDGNKRAGDDRTSKSVRTQWCHDRTCAELAQRACQKWSIIRRFLDDVLVKRNASFNANSMTMAQRRKAGEGKKRKFKGGGSTSSGSSSSSSSTGDTAGTAGTKIAAASTNSNTHHSTQQVSKKAKTKIHI